MAAQEETPKDDDRLSAEIMWALDHLDEADHEDLARRINVSYQHTAALLANLQRKGYVATRHVKHSGLEALLLGRERTLASLTPEGRADPQLLQIANSTTNKIIRRRHEGGEEIAVYNQLRYFRLRKELSRAELAGEVGVNPRSLAIWEAQEPPVLGLDTAFRLSKTLDVSFEELFQPGEGI